MSRVYATRTDLLAYTAGSGLVVPSEPDATRKLTRASEKVDDFLLTAIYDVDDVTLLPTHAAVIEALMLATCAQAAWWIETGDETGASSLFQTVSIGSVSLGRGNSGAGSAPGAATARSEDAMGHLRRAAPHLRLGVVSTYGVGWLA